MRILKTLVACLFVEIYYTVYTVRDRNSETADITAASFGISPLCRRARYRERLEKCNETIRIIKCELDVKRFLTDESAFSLGASLNFSVIDTFHYRETFSRYCREVKVASFFFN